MYTVFTRTWWTENPKWPKGLEPKAGCKTFIKTTETEQEAREFCLDGNKNRPYAWLKLSRKYEFTSGGI